MMILRMYRAVWDMTCERNKFNRIVFASDAYNAIFSIFAFLKRLYKFLYDKDIVFN